MKKWFSLMFIIMFFAFSSCREKIVDDNVMVETYVNVMVIKEMYINFQDSLQIKVNEVYAKAGITEEDFLRTLESYSDDAEKWESFYKNTLVYLDSLRRKDNSKNASSLQVQF